MRELEVFGFKHHLTGLSDDPVDAPYGTSESMLLSGISLNIFGFWYWLSFISKVVSAYSGYSILTYIFCIFFAFFAFFGTT